MATATKQTSGLSNEQLIEVLELVKGADSVELKLTIPESSQRSTVAALEMDPLDAQIRQVFFFETPELALNKAGVVVRARRVQGKGNDSVVKLRPVVPAELPDELRKSPNLGVEVDALPGGFVCSASFKAKLPPTAVRDTILGGKPLRKLFSKEQREFFAANAPEGIELDDLSVMGPIFVLKLKWSPREFGRPLVAELWLYPDGSRILELSTKCTTDRAGAGRGRGPRLPGQEGCRSLGRAADEDEDGARVLRERAGGCGRSGLLARVAGVAPPSACGHICSPGREGLTSRRSLSASRSRKVPVSSPQATRARRICEAEVALPMRSATPSTMSRVPTTTR